MSRREGGSGRGGKGGEGVYTLLVLIDPWNPVCWRMVTNCKVNMVLVVSRLQLSYSLDTLTISDCGFRAIVCISR